MNDNIRLYNDGTNPFMQDSIMCECNYTVVSIYNPITFEDSFYHCFTCADVAQRFYDSIIVPDGMAKDIVNDFHFVKITKDNTTRAHILNGDGIKSIGNDTNNAWNSFDAYVNALQSACRNTSDQKKRKAQNKVAKAIYYAWRATDKHMFVSHCVVSFACDLFYLACDFADDNLSLNYLMHVAKKFVETFEIQY